MKKIHYAVADLDTQIRLCEAFYPITLDPRTATPPLLRGMAAAGRLGRKSGRGGLSAHYEISRALFEVYATPAYAPARRALVAKQREVKS